MIRRHAIAAFRADRLVAGFGLLLATLALAVQLAVGGLAMPRLAQDDFTTALAATICHADTAAPDQDNPPAPHHAPDCALCPLCQAIAHAHALLTPSLAVVASGLVAMLDVMRTSSHARPDHPATPATARGPPSTR